MKDRYLDNFSLHLIERRDKKRSDRRKAINSYVDPEHDRRLFDRRSTDDFIKRRNQKIKKLKENKKKKERRDMIYAAAAFVGFLWISAYLLTEWIVNY
jgi:ribonucleotide reductase beta subunit family protein with ferritin-like domain